MAVFTLTECYLPLAKSLPRLFTSWPVKSRVVKLGIGRCLLFRGILVPKPLGIRFHSIWCKREDPTGHIAKSQEILPF